MCHNHFKYLFINNVYKHIDKDIMLQFQLCSLKHESINSFKPMCCNHLKYLFINKVYKHIDIDIDITPQLSTYDRSKSKFKKGKGGMALDRQSIPDKDLLLV